MPSPDSNSYCFRQPLAYPDDPGQLYRRLRSLPLPVLLCSGNNPALDGRYDILSAAPETVLRTHGRITTVTRGDGQTRSSTENPFEVLQQEFERSAQTLHIEQLPGLFPGGALGYFAYELLHPWYGIEPRADDDIMLPSMLVGIYHWAVIIDHQEQTCEYIALPGLAGSERDRILELLKGRSDERDDTDFNLATPFASNFSPDEYAQAFRRVIDYIHAGDCYQVNLSQRFTADYEGDPLHAFEHLQPLANAPFSAFLEDGNSAVLSFSPERFIRVRDLDVLTQPIKGTRPRASDPEQDQALKEELQNSKKDQAENLMIVDLLRNDLGRVCETGSVEVPALFEIQSFNNVHHLVSTVSGSLRQSSEIFDLFSASFPGGSITGAPKIRSMQIINELETRPRSVYCGSIAYIGFNGNMDSNICIRTLVCANQRIHCWGGGGVVADSEGDREYQETLDKISMFLNRLSGTGQR